ncbi:MAG: cytochrome c peroxidase [Bacteroidota bacterium]
MMNKICVLSFIMIFTACLFLSFKKSCNPELYLSNFKEELSRFSNQQLLLLKEIEKSNLNNNSEVENIKQQINLSRIKLKGMDFWLRYLQPNTYRKINGPLPVEWETEVFEKYEKPYKREGAGLTLASLYLDESVIEKDSLMHLIQSSISATAVYNADSVTDNLKTYNHFYLCNRLFLLNLAAIYTTGFECPDTLRIIPELRSMLANVGNAYQSFNESFPNTPITSEYLSLYKNTIDFVNKQSDNFSLFNHFAFLKEYVNPLFSLNQKLIKQYRVTTKSVVDYTLNNSCNSIFSKTLYYGQNPKGIFVHVDDEKALAEIDHIGKLLFYDPILSGNNLRSCASCHKSAEYFADTTTASSLQYNRKDFLKRNSPSLINAGFNHLLTLDGKQLTLQSQAKAVICNPLELGCNEKEVMEKVLSCREYKKAFTEFLKYTPQEDGITFDHIVSAITIYYSKFSNYYSPFDNAMNENKNIDASVQHGFNLFMSKTQCATCHFVPHFNGVKPPFVSSEFEVLGVPDDTTFKKLNADSGRYDVNPAKETLFAFRTGSIRNAEHTKPYMHNGVFTDLNQVIDFYDTGGGAGKGIKTDNQSLSSDSLHLSKAEKSDLVLFIKSLNENIAFENPPENLPSSNIKSLNKRKVGGEY